MLSKWTHISRALRVSVTYSSRVHDTDHYCTVREALLFSARLRQPRDVPEAEKAEYVESCLKMCGLEAFADAIVGSLGVEHRKRTTIAVELAAKVMSPVL
jgi:ABC-type multidrug transport system ATPase subunit